MSISVQRPEITENHQLRVFVCDNKQVEDAFNGALHALIIFGPTAIYLGVTI